MRHWQKAACENLSGFNSPRLKHKRNHKLQKFIRYLPVISYLTLRNCKFLCNFPYIRYFPLESQKRMVYNTGVYAFFAKNLKTN